MHPRRRLGPAHEHPAAAGRGGRRPLGAAPRRTDHPAAARGAGARRPRAPALATLWMVTAVITVVAGLTSSGRHRRRARPLPRPGRWWRAPPCSSPSGRSRSQLAATRRQAAAYAAVVLGVELRRCGWWPTPGSGCTGSSGSSPLGWVEELQPAHRAPAAGPRARSWRFTGRASACSPCTSPARRDVGASVVADRAARRAHAPAARRARPGCRPAGPRRPSSAGGCAIAVDGPAARAHRQVGRRHDLGLLGARRSSPSSGRPGPAPRPCLGVCFLILAVLVAFVAAGQVTRARGRGGRGPARPPPGRRPGRAGRHGSAAGSASPWPSLVVGGLVAGLVDLGRARPASAPGSARDAARRRAQRRPPGAVRARASGCSRSGVWPRAAVGRRLWRRRLVPAGRGRRRHRRRRATGCSTPRSSTRWPRRRPPRPTGRRTPSMVAVALAAAGIGARALASRDLKGE